MEGVCCITSVLCWVSEWADDVEEFQYRSGPAMGDEKRLRLRVGAPDVEEMDLNTVNFGDEVVVLIEQ